MLITVEKGKTIPFEELPPKSIALDGYVQGPAIDAESERFSFDHHDGCIRLVTSATCRQVLDALLLGLNPEEYTIFVNDVDEDTILSVWLLENRDRINEERVRWLVDRESEVDAHGVAYPTIDSTDQLFARFSRSIMEPVNQCQQNGNYNQMNLAKLLRLCVDRVSPVLDDPDPELVDESDDRSFEIRHHGVGGWVMVESKEKIFDLLYAQGYTKAIVYSQMANGSYLYTVMKQSDLTPSFPVGPHSSPNTILARLATLEPGWGGSSRIGGSPRNVDGTRSLLSPEKVAHIVDNLLSQ